MSGQEFPPEKIYLAEWLLTKLAQGERIAGISIKKEEQVNPWTYGVCEQEIEKK